MERKVYTYKGYSFRKSNTSDKMYGTSTQDYHRIYIGEVTPYEIKKNTQKTWKRTCLDTIEEVKDHINYLIRKEESKKRKAEFKKELDKTFGKLY